MLIRATVWLLVFLLAMGQPATLLASDYFGQVTFNGVPVPGATVTATRRDRKASATTNAGRDLPPRRSRGRTLDADDRDVRLRDDHARDRDARGEEPPPDALGVRSFDELTRALPPARVFDDPTSPRTTSEPVEPRGATGPAGMGAADGLLINGSLNNGASTPFALPRGIGNNRPRPPGVYTYAAGLQLGSSAWDARPFSLTGSQRGQAVVRGHAGARHVPGAGQVPWLRNPITLMLGYQGTSATNATTQFTRMPTALERAGDFSQTLDARGQPVRIVDPATGQPFDGSAIPPDASARRRPRCSRYYPRRRRGCRRPVQLRGAGRQRHAAGLGTLARRVHDQGRQPD